MKRVLYGIFLLSSIIVINGCVSLQSKPVTGEQINSIKNNKTAVMFYDSDENITYKEDMYLVLAVTTSTTFGSYKGFWNINKDMSEYHASLFRTQGINAESAYVRLDSSEVSYLKNQQKNMKTLYISSSSTTDKKKNEVDPSLRQSLLNKGYRYLIWVPHFNYTLHIQTLGLSPREQINLGYLIYDLEKNKTIWKGRFTEFSSVKLQGKKGKDFLEKDGLSGYKNRLKMLTKKLYKSGKIGKAVGF